MRVSPDFSTGNLHIRFPIIFNTSKLHAMKIIFTFLLAITVVNGAFAQKKPLDHTVYDGWQSIGERMVSNDGKWVLYTVTPQEGDNDLVIQSSDGIIKKSIARGYGAMPGSKM